MERIINEKNGIIKSQKSLYIRFKKVNKLFKIHFSSLTMIFLLSLGFIIIWIYLMITGQATTDLSQRYGLFGNIMTIILTVALCIFIIQIGFQIYIFSFFLIKGTRCLRQIKGKEETRTALYKGIVPYITNFYTFFKRFSKERTNLVLLVRTFLFFNFFSGFIGIFLLTRILNAEFINEPFLFCMFILFISMFFFWLINLMTSFKIKKEIAIWENLFPKLEEWAQDLENFSSENTFFSNTEEPS
ncbi:MAG: hypothetical protein ACFFDY_15550 [Candidatus Thorarchaeota archaeon]